MAEAADVNLGMFHYHFKTREAFLRAVLARDLTQAGEVRERAAELGALVEVKYSEENTDLQVKQAEELIAKGAKALVVVASDAAAAGTIVDKAHAAGVKVIAYDRMILDSDVDLFVTFDSRVRSMVQWATASSNRAGSFSAQLCSSRPSSVRATERRSRTNSAAPDSSSSR